MLFKNLLEPSGVMNGYTNYIYAGMNEVLLYDQKKYNEAVKLLEKFERETRVSLSQAEKEVFVRVNGLTRKQLCIYDKREIKPSKHTKLPARQRKYTIINWMELEASLVALKHDIYNLCKKFFDEKEITMDSMLYSPVQ
jgi:hypothetical protein